MEQTIKSLKALFQEVNKMERISFVLIFILTMAYIFREPITELITRAAAIEDDPVMATISKARLVNDVLDNMRKDFDAGRAYIYAYHNGINYVNEENEHIIRTSVMFERVRKGIKPHAPEMQKIPVSLFAEQLHEIRRERVFPIAYTDVKDEAARAAMGEFGNDYSAVLPYYDRDHCYRVHRHDPEDHNDQCRLLYCIGLDWVAKDDLIFNENHKQLFRKYVKNLGDLLTNSTTEGRLSLYGATRGEQIDTTKKQVIPAASIEASHPFKWKE